MTTSTINVKQITANRVKDLYIKKCSISSKITGLRLYHQLILIFHKITQFAPSVLPPSDLKLLTAIPSTS